VKWDKPNGSVQWSADRRYHVQQATSGFWIAYAVSPFQNTAEKLGEYAGDGRARQACDEHESLLIAARQTA
jgi:hypothetical protein